MLNRKQVKKNILYFFLYALSGVTGCVLAFVLSLQFLSPVFSQNKEGGNDSLQQQGESKPSGNFFQNIKLIGKELKNLLSDDPKIGKAASKISSDESNQETPPPPKLDGFEQPKPIEISIGSNQNTENQGMPSAQPAIEPLPTEAPAAQPATAPSAAGTPPNQPATTIGAPPNQPATAPSAAGTLPNQPATAIGAPPNQPATAIGAPSNQSATAPSPAGTPHRSNTSEELTYTAPSAAGVHPNQPATVPSPAGAPLTQPIAATPAGEEEVPMSGSLLQLKSYMEPFIYDPATKRRNPFDDPTQEKPDQRTAGIKKGIQIIRSPTELYPLKDIELRGIIWDVKSPKALFKLPENQGFYTLLKGDRLGKYGVIEEISEDKVKISEIIVKEDEVGQQTETRKTIKRINRLKF